jgi:flagellar biosynthetic protein FliO
MDIVQDLAAIGAVLSLLTGTLWWLRKRGFSGFLSPKRDNSRKLECLERLSLGPQHTLHLIRVGNESLLLASTPSGCTLVQNLASPCPVREPEETR